MKKASISIALTVERSLIIQDKEGAVNRFFHRPCSLPMIIIVIGEFILAGCIGTAPRIVGFSSPLELDPTILCNETVSKPDGTKRNTPCVKNRSSCKDIPIPGKGEEVWLKASLDWIERVNLPNLGVPKGYTTQDGTLSKQFAADLVAYQQCLKRGRSVPGAGSKLQHSVASSSQSSTPTNGTTCTPPHNL